MYGRAQNSKLCELDFLVSTDTGMVTNIEAHTLRKRTLEKLVTCIGALGSGPMVVAVAFPLA
jgi:hypothetical protein